MELREVTADQRRRVVIVNGDDFGLSEDVNRGIAIAYESGILSSASLMATGAAAESAAAYAKSHPDLSLGLHVDLGSWMHRDGEWLQLYHIVNLEDTDAVTVEVERQLERFRLLRGCDPTHLDSHQHVHVQDPARAVLLEAGRSLNIPVRRLTPGLQYDGSYYGQTGTGEKLHGAIRPERLMEILKSLPFGITELGCHPALGQNTGDPVYSAEREEELRALCDPRVRNTLETEGIELRSFLTVANAWWAEGVTP
jgi:predicted glycoside hydrolase/deacetylase ChbG (UPF0249 family)